MRLINKDALRITGLSGDGTKTGRVWQDFTRLHQAKPFPKADENGYEIRFHKSRATGKTPAPEKSVHVGFATRESDPVDGFHTLLLPACDYAVFDVFVAKGYDSGNAEMEQWLADNAAVWRMLEVDGVECVVECYSHLI